MINLVALPCLCVDVFDGTDELYAGGEALNFAAHASKFEEFNVSILGAVGQDSYAKFIMDSISDKRIDISHVRVEKDKVTANNRTYLTAGGDRYYKDDSWTGDIVDKMILDHDELEFIKKSDVVFVHFWAGCFGQIIDLKKNNNFRLAVDFVEYRNFKEMEKYAPYIDYFMISGEKSILPIFEAFSKKYKGLFNVSLADKGSVTYHNGEKYFVQANEVKEVIDICNSVKAELKADGIEYSEETELGIMIETPAAALISDKLAQLVDFFSVGTNDLTQYTLACDRQNPDIERFCDTHHEAVLKLIEIATDNAHKYGKWIGICGELAADTTLTETFLRMGIDELSVSPAFVLKVRDKVRNINLS